MTKTKTNTLPPRLKSKQRIEQLFNGKDSKAASIFPLRAIYRRYSSNDTDDASQQLLFSVSKRHFKRAVKRNRAKRQMREAFRLNKSIIAGQPMDIAFVWLADNLYDSERVHKAMVRLLDKISHSAPSDNTTTGQ